jgi:hypothetical protein
MGLPDAAAKATEATAPEATKAATAAPRGIGSGSPYGCAATGVSESRHAIPAQKYCCAPHHPWWFAK